VPLEFDFAIAGDFGTALLLGALLGVERENRKMREGFGSVGLRSFVLLAQLGAIGGYLGKELSAAWILPATLVAATALVLAGYVAAARERPKEIGLTTELAAIVACLLGAMATTGHREIAVGLGVVTAAMLAYKQPLHALVAKLGQDDVRVGVRFLLAMFIVLPLLPNEPIDPWGAINPYKLWLLVLLISGLSLIGYIATRWLGPGRGIAVTAIAGGLASSTALTLSFVRQSREQGASPGRLAGGILIGWSVMFVRVIVTAAIIYLPLLGQMAPAFVAMALVCGGYGWWCLRRAGAGQGTAEVLVKNPFSLVAASKFVVLFAVVQLVLKLGQEYLPGGGVYAIAALAGTTDVDAITLSMAERARGTPDNLGPAVTAILIACASNTLVKAGMAVGMGTGLARYVLTGTGLVLATGVLALLLV
jgi:uncharacterized membrane protein (DUF4010 family)